MKVVLFCGGLGMRMRADNQSLPKPMMPIGSRPVLWHVMRYYAHFGHKEFILCLGHGAQAVKDYFVNYRETTSNDFVLRRGGEDIEMLSTDISEWTISFIDTGIDTPIGERLRRVRKYLDGDEMFLANYGDVLTDAPMNELIDQFTPTRCGGPATGREAAGFLPCGRHRDRFHGHRADRRGGHGHEDQRRLLRPSAGHLRLPQRGRGSGDGRLHARRPGRPDARRAVRRVLGAHGHTQGAKCPRGQYRRATVLGRYGGNDRSR